jgi:glycosyltransferase involved in cell wall biosynthesis
MRDKISVVIPIFNEEEILFERIIAFDKELRDNFEEYEIILTENGSVDDTKNIAKHIASQYDKVEAVIEDAQPDYGQALINGINECKFNKVAIMELDYLDMSFFYSAYDMLNDYDLIIGSKKLGNNIDQRGFKRRMFTKLYNILLKWSFNLKLTETHGLKLLNKSKLDSITNGCVTRHAVWPSEFVIRASRDADLRVTEIPLKMPLREIRTTRIKALARLKKTFDDLMLLRRALN